MLFHSPVFFLFLAIVLGLHRVLPWGQGRWLLLTASYVFYGAAEPWYCLLLVSSTLVDFWMARAIHRSDDPLRRRLFLSLSLAVNLGLLGLFKYADFFIDSINRVAGTGFPLLGLLLPVGISFYTFQTLSYTIDVYRREMEPTRDFATFALYVSFFPQLVAGPIERARRLLPQLAVQHRATKDDLEAGCQRILWGLVKKLVVADRLAILVSEVFADPQPYPGPVLLIAMLCFLFQLYLDFSAYTDIAIGVARLLGIQLSENFDWPFLARNPSEFWRRWHMSLTRWFGDYVQRPLRSQNPESGVVAFVSTIMVMGLVGLWHGAAWNFIAFGLLAGLSLAISNLVRGWRRSRGLGPCFGSAWWSTPLAVLCTFTHVLACAVLFGCSDLSTAWDVFSGVFTNPWFLPRLYTYHLWAIVGLALVHIGRGTFMRGRGPLALRPPVRGAFWALMAVLVIYGVPERTEPFVYFQF